MKRKTKLISLLSVFVALAVVSYFAQIYVVVSSTLQKFSVKDVLMQEIDKSSYALKENGQLVETQDYSVNIPNDLKKTQELQDFDVYMKKSDNSNKSNKGTFVYKNSINNELDSYDFSEEEKEELKIPSNYTSSKLSEKLYSIITDKPPKTLIELTKLEYSISSKDIDYFNQNKTAAVLALITDKEILKFKQVYHYNNGVIDGVLCLTDTKAKSYVFNFTNVNNTKMQNQLAFFRYDSIDDMVKVINTIQYKN